MPVSSWKLTVTDVELTFTEEVTTELLDQYADHNSEKYANMVESIRQQMKFDSLKFQTLENTKTAIGIDPCKLCTYCWDGKE